MFLSWAYTNTTNEEIQPGSFQLHILPKLFKRKFVIEKVTDIWKKRNKNFGLIDLTASDYRQNSINDNGQTYIYLYIWFLIQTKFISQCTRKVYSHRMISFENFVFSLLRTTIYVINKKWTLLVVAGQKFLILQGCWLLFPTTLLTFIIDLVVV